MAKIIKMNEQDMEKLIKKIIKEDELNELNYVYNKMIKAGIIEPETVNKYDNYFEIFGIKDKISLESIWIEICVQN